MIGRVISRSVAPVRLIVRGSLVAALVVAALVLAALPAAAQEQIWVRQLGTVRWDTTWAAAGDGSGGVYVGGDTYGNLAGANAGAVDAWVARYDEGGERVWIHQFGTSGSEFTFALAADGAGGVYACGHTQGALAGAHAGLVDAWIVRFDRAGNALWRRQFGTSVKDYLRAATQDGNGGVYVTGDTDGNFAGPNKGSKDAWLARYDRAGNQLWLRQLGTPSGDISQAIAPDRMQGVYIAGYTGGSLASPNAGSSDAFLAHYDSAGTLLWTRQLGTSGIDEVDTAAADGADGVYVAGHTAGALGGTSAGATDAWLARYDDHGNLQWIRQLGTNTTDIARAAAPDGGGGLFLSGSTGGLLGPQSFGGQDVWLARYDDMGGRAWSWQLGTSSHDSVFAAAIDGEGRLFLGGTTWGSLGGPSAGELDAWMACYDGSCTSGASYCTASQTSIAGCQAAIHGVGFPHASDPTAFQISSGNIPGGTRGICFFGNSGPASTPIGTLGGQTCVQSPLFLCKPKSGGGTHGNCDGELSFTLQDLIAVSPIVVSGATLNAQIWAGDPANPDGFLLSDGLEFTVCP